MPDIYSLIETAGYAGIFTMLFAESGMVVGFFLPGDSLLFTAGILASQGIFNIVILATGSFIAAVLGDSVGYAIGKKYGRKLFLKKDSWFFKKEHLHASEAFFKEHGGKTIIIARFIPVIRAFAPIIAGIGAMPYAFFILYNIIGGLIWAVGLSLLGYFLGQTIPNIGRYIEPIVVVIIFLSILPNIIHALQSKEIRGRIAQYFKRGFKG